MSDPIKTKQRIGMIWAQTADLIIGVGGKMAWDVPADMRHFVETTRDCAVIMGHTTWDSLNGPLPRRHNIVISRNRDLHLAGCEVVHCVEDALKAAAPHGPIAWVIGGGSIYRLFEPVADELKVSTIDLDIKHPNATTAPAIDKTLWRIDPQRSDNDWREVSGDARWRLTTWVRN